MGVTDSELFGKEFNDKIQDIDRELQKFDSEKAKNHGKGILNARTTCVDIDLEGVNENNTASFQPSVLIEHVHQHASLSSSADILSGHGSGKKKKKNL